MGSCVRGDVAPFNNQFQPNRACSAALLQQTSESVKSDHFHRMSLLDSRRNSTMRAAADTFSFRSVGVRVLFCALVLCASVIPTMSQSTATLSGTITDPAGAAVPNAKVTAINQATNVASNTQTDGAGAYLFSSLPMGKYRIEATASGFPLGSSSRTRFFRHKHRRSARGHHQLAGQRHQFKRSSSKPDYLSAAD